MERFLAALTAFRTISVKSDFSRTSSPAAVVPLGLVISAFVKAGVFPRFRRRGRRPPRAPLSRRFLHSPDRVPLRFPLGKGFKRRKIHYAKAGPLPLRAVTVSRSSSGTSMAVPTEAKILGPFSDHHGSPRVGGDGGDPLAETDCGVRHGPDDPGSLARRRLKVGGSDAGDDGDQQLAGELFGNPPQHFQGLCGFHAEKDNFRLRDRIGVRGGGRDLQEEAVFSADVGVFEETVIRSPGVIAEASIPLIREHPILPPPSTA